MNFTPTATFAEMSDAERLSRVRVAQRLSATIGPQDRHITTPQEWGQLNQQEQHELMLREELEVANRRLFVSRQENYKNLMGILL